MTPNQAVRIMTEAIAKLAPDYPLRSMVERAIAVFSARAGRGDLDGPSNRNEIVMFFHCGKCLDEFRTAKGIGESPESYARLSVGFTPRGMQVWCVRHDINVVHVDYEGVQHAANQTAAIGSNLPN